VRPVVVGERAGRVVGALDHEPGGTGLEDEGVVVAVAGLGTGVGDEFHPEGGLEEMRGLHRVADDPHERIPAGDRKGVTGGVVLDQADQLLELFEVQVGQALLVVEGLLEAHARFLLPWSIGRRLRRTAHQLPWLRKQPS
jgi:hypothetical protein